MVAIAVWGFQTGCCARAHRFSGGGAGGVTIKGIVCVRKESRFPEGRPLGRKATSIDRLIAARVRLRREILGLGDIELAARLGISRQQLNKYETAANRVPAARLADLAWVLDVPINYFFLPFPDEEPTAGRGNVVPFPTAAAVAASREERLVTCFRAMASEGDRELVISLAERLVRRPPGV